MSFVSQPQTEGVDRFDVGVARDGLDVAFPQIDDELLQGGLRQRRLGAERALQRLERRLIPLNRLGVTFFK